MTFEQLGLSAPILKALKEQGYVDALSHPGEGHPPRPGWAGTCWAAPRRARARPAPLPSPFYSSWTSAPYRGRPIRALILTPTRELAIQIGESFDAYGKYLKLRHTVIFGGVGQNPQVEALKRGVDILVATPGPPDGPVSAGLCLYG